MLVTERIDDAKQPYERLLGGAAVGGPTLFAREDVVEAAWRVVNPVLGPTATPVITYEAGTWGPTAAAHLPGLSGWHDPEMTA